MNKIIYLIISSLISLQSLAGFEHESEVGIVIISGETTSKTENLKHSSIFSWNETQASFKGRYLHLSNESKNTELWEMNFRIERQLNSEVFLFIGKSFEGRKPKDNTDLGIKTQCGSFINEIGYRITVEDDDKSDFLRLYSEISNENLKFWIEALFDKETQINFEPSLMFILNDKLSLKISYLYKSRKENPADTIYITSLIAKY